MTETLPAAPARDAIAVRRRIVDLLRRDLIGPAPGPEDADLSAEILSENPSRWYLTGFLAPALDSAEEELGEEGDTATAADEGADAETGPARAADDAPPDEPSSRPRRLPSSLGLTVLLDASIDEVEVELTWGDYVTEPPLPEAVLTAEGAEYAREYRDVRWRRVPGSYTLRIPVPHGRGPQIAVPGSGGAQRPRGGLTVEAHARPYGIRQPDGSVSQVRALTVMVVNRRSSVRRRFADLSFAFQMRMALRCEAGFFPRHDLSGHGSADADAATADLHYADVAEYAVGRGVSAGWSADADGAVRAVLTDHLPEAEVERVEPNETITAVEFRMEALVSLARAGGGPLAAALEGLPAQYAAWIETQSGLAVMAAGASRRATADRLLTAARVAQARIADGIAILRDDPRARRAFEAMNESVARAARRRNAGPGGDPAAEKAPTWRPFQLAFILLNLRGLAEPTHSDREIADLLFFPTGGGKTEAYLGLAAWIIAHRRLANGGLLGAGITVLMRYTLRLLTLDQLSRAAGVVCALELMRGEPAWCEDGRKVLGDWPIEIGLWVGSAASPNRLGKTGDKRDDTALARIRRFRRDGKEAPAPLKVCPWCGHPFGADSFALHPSDAAPRNMVIRCANATCDFTRDRALPILTVDEAIYRRLPACLIATVDKFAGLPWVGEAGAFFAHVDRADEWGFFGAAEPGAGKRLWNGHTLLPPDLIVQDELHLISGPLGTVAALYETALDRLATREVAGQQVRPKIVASTATVRRAEKQVSALFDRQTTAVFPPPGPDRRDSFFARTVSAETSPARLYVGIASPGRGPKLIFLRVLTTLLAAAAAEAAAGGDADGYGTALCYFNALRELGGARRIVEDEVRTKLATYGAQRRRVEPAEPPFIDHRIGEPLELTSRVSTDLVAAAKDALAQPLEAKDGVHVALATNMISVGLDIGRLALMLVQGQPKTASEYIQATSRVGRRLDRPGLVLALLNVHKPRDRMHHEHFRHFHTCFYRSVEATSITPWAARALDRALAAVVVAAARHIDPALTPENAASRITDDPGLREAVVRLVLARAPKDAVVGGHAALRLAVEGLIDAWSRASEELTKGGQGFPYAHPRERALLHDALDPLLGTLLPEQRKFTAGRSMRDVEHSTPLKIVDPYGNVLN